MDASPAVRCEQVDGAAAAADAEGFSALHAVLNARDQTESDKRVRQLRESVCSVAERVEWDAEDWKDFYLGLTEIFARIADRHAAKAGHGPVRTDRRSRVAGEAAGQVAVADP